MSKKRKLEGQDSSHNGPIDERRPMSAFEAARARAAIAEQHPSDNGFDQGDSPYESGNEGDIDQLRTANHDPADALNLLDERKIMTTWTASSSSILRSDRSGEVLRMKYLDQLSVIGTYRLRVIKGKVSVDAAELSAKSRPITVNAFASQALPSISCIATAGADIELSSVSSPMQILARISPLYRSLGADADESTNCLTTGRTFSKMDKSNQDPLGRPLSSLHITEEFKNAFDAMFEAEKPTTTVVAGAKHSGKSSFTRLATNHFLTRRNFFGPREGTTSRTFSYILEMDFQRPEFGPPFQISLVEIDGPWCGPAYTRSFQGTHSPWRIVQAHAMSESMQSRDRSYLTKCVLELVALHQKIARGRAPLIINTGPQFLDLESDAFLNILRQIRFKQFIHLDTGKTSEQVYKKLQAQSQEQDACFINIQCRTNTNLLRSDKQLQDMQTISYFHTEYSPGSETQRNPIVIQERPGVSVKYGGEARGLIGIISYHKLHHAHLHSTLEGNVLSVLVTEDATFVSRYQDSFSEGPHGIPYIPSDDSIEQILNPEHTRVIGLALLVNIDFQNQTFELIVPQNCAECLRNIQPRNILLLHGCVPMPTWAYKESIYGAQHDLLTRHRQLADNQSASDMLSSVASSHQSLQGTWIEEIDKYGKLCLGRIGLDMETAT